MARKAKHPEHESHERWLVSYADFITLLFAFFVVLFAKADSDKAKKLSQAVSDALNEANAVALISEMLNGASDPKLKGNTQSDIPSTKQPVSGNAVLADLIPTLRYLSGELSQEIGAGKVNLKMQSRGLTISLMEAAFFPSGEDTIAHTALPTVGKIADALGKIPNPMRLEGHTDSVPIHNSRFRSNWELSAARSVAMLQLLTTRYRIPHQRLSVAGYADNAPVESNDTDVGRSRNRRVDLVVLNKLGVFSEPEKNAGASASRPESPATSVATRPKQAGRRAAAEAGSH